MKSEQLFDKDFLNTLHEGIYFTDQERRITYWSQGAERITGYTVAEVLHKPCSEILMHVNNDGVSLCTAMCLHEQTLRNDSVMDANVFLHHKDGHRIPVTVTITPFKDAHDRVVGAVEVFRDASSTVAALQRLQELESMIFIDALTELANRRYIEMSIRGRMEEMVRYEWPFGILFMDIDNFKRVNDCYGHQAGDDVLRVVAKTLISTTRSFDLVGRWGGEEFIAILANVDIDKLEFVANRFCMLVEQSVMTSGRDTIRCTISVGATLARNTDTLESLIERADALMYRAKAAGRNCVIGDLTTLAV